MEKCANAIADWLVRCAMIDEEDKELYRYAAYSLILSISPLLLAIGFGICMGRVKESVMITLPFMLIRKFSGGYHTKHAWSCMICSCLLLFLCITEGLAVSDSNATPISSLDIKGGIDHITAYDGSVGFNRITRNPRLSYAQPHTFEYILELQPCSNVNVKRFNGMVCQKRYNIDEKNCLLYIVS